MRNSTVPEPCDHVVNPDDWQRGGMASCGICGQAVELGPRERKHTGPPFCWNDGSTMTIIERSWVCQDPTCGVTRAAVLDV